jgi:formate dehydrogenase major subunit
MLDAAIDVNAHMRESFKTVLFMDYVASSITEWANVALPGRAWFEKEGTFINVDDRVQRIQPALKPPSTEIMDDLYTLAHIYHLLHGDKIPWSAADVFKMMADEHDVFNGMNYGTMGMTGALLNGKEEE